jgi:hypothetical protein
LGRNYANITSTLALIVALGGTGAYAADKLGGGDIARNAITSKHLKNGKVRKQDLSRKVTGCPSGMVNLRGTVCVDREPRGGEVTWAVGRDRCRSAGLRLPSPSEAYMALEAGSIPAPASIWVDVIYRRADGAGTADSVVDLFQSTPGGGGSYFHGDLGGDEFVVCATPPGTR